MSHPSKQKGSRLERRIVKMFQDAGFQAERAWGSNGRALGETDEVDNVATIGKYRLLIQAKSRKKIAGFMKPPEGCNAAIIKGDREDSLIVMRVKDFLDLACANQGTSGTPSATSERPADTP